MTKPTRRRGDRRDAALTRELDSMHVFMPFVLPNRTDNEAVMREIIDLTAVEAYIAEKNAENPAYCYTIFQVLCAAFAKVIHLRPKLNRFITGQRTYDRHDLSFTFVVKKQFTDEAHESMAILKFDREGEASPIDQFRDKLDRILHSVRVDGQQDSTTDIMDIFKKLPKWLTKVIVRVLVWMDTHHGLPKSLAEADPYQCTVFMTNLGSIKMHASYHHLANWGTNSLFVVVSEKGKRPVYHDDGSYELRSMVELGITVDERIADGVYFAHSIRLLRRLLAHPELLEQPFNAPIPEEDT